MKSIEELKKTAHLCITGRMPTSVIPQAQECDLWSGWVEWDNFRATVVWGYKENGWEHVSVSHMNRHKMPTWDDMCRLKEMFWGKDVTVCQFHPAEAAYVHSVGTPGKELKNVLHLWRPIDGDWSVITEEMMKTL